MKKTLGVVCVLTLFVALCPQVNAYVPFQTCEDRFVGVEGRDAFNRPVEDDFRFNESVFFKVYSLISPFGICRWHINSTQSTEISRDKSFKIPYVAVPFIYSNRAVLPRVSEKYLPRNLILYFLTSLLLVSFILSFAPNLQSKDEPRFRVPVFLE